ncbi:hypothetical protein L3N51_01392 [Metallosphaera sp. J1]|uniref:hypothetical protein n=1 Tax=Metallosphaera javensis (ex Hofmann et al. 2022) TaxID=99938 RepID=UPI001EDF29F0|nr:hypothetical protein [Metallosphaera javensis (ex Hofmann et al. 2022)]MCG3109102.1 hypothetical protein [Metallosphaera javensis (ex Hofmann et al. 2022)]
MSGIEINDADISKVLMYIQRFGDLNPKIIGALARMKNAESVIKLIKEEFSLHTSYLVRYKSIGLKAILALVNSDPRIELTDIYEMLDGFTTFVGRDQIYNEKLIINLVFPQKFENEIINILTELEEHNMFEIEKLLDFEDSIQFAYDFSTYDFKLRRYKDQFLVEPREPVYFPDLSDGFEPDWVDLQIIGKKQARNYLTLKQIANLINVKYKTVLKHYQEHVIGKGLITAFGIRLNGRYQTRLSIIFNENEEFLRELTRIPTLTHVHRLSGNTYFGIAFLEDPISGKILEYISQLKYKYHVDADIMIHPFEPRLKYLLAASIPYEHFTVDGRWTIDTQKMLDNVRKVKAKLMGSNPSQSVFIPKFHKVE